MPPCDFPFVIQMFVAASMDSVKELLVSGIPTLQGEKLDAVLTKMAAIGVQGLSDLNFVEAKNDFDGILLPVEARKVAHLLASFQQSSGELIFLLLVCKFDVLNHCHVGLSQNDIDVVKYKRNTFSRGHSISSQQMFCKFPTRPLKC